MARIRIVDEWLRSPVSAPSRQRAILVVARSWAEQRVLMRAFASSSDQSRPTINLHGEELAIGPAGTDPHGEWGIHVQPPVDGRAQHLREALQLAARLLAGSKGNPPRLQDEVPDLEDRATNNWAPVAKDGANARTVFGRDAAVRPPAPEPAYYEPALHAPASASAEIPSSASARARSSTAKERMRKTPPFWADLNETPELEQGSSATPAFSPPTAAPMQSNPSGQLRRSIRQTNRYSGVMVAAAQSQGQARPQKPPAATVFGFLPEEGPKENYAATASKTMPLGLTLADGERLVLNELGKRPQMSASEIATLLNISDPMEWMSGFMDKLAEFGLDLVAPGTDLDGEATYLLIR